MTIVLTHTDKMSSRIQTQSNQNFLDAAKMDFLLMRNKQYIQLESSTPGGITISHTLNTHASDSLQIQFEKEVEGFKVNDYVDHHREEQDYRENHTVKESTEDFEEHLRFLQHCAKRYAQNK